MTFPAGWPPRPASGRRNIRFYQTGTSTGLLSDNSFLFINSSGANTFVPTPVVQPGSINTKVQIGSYTAGGSPMGGGPMVDKTTISPMIWSVGIRITNVGTGNLQFSFDGMNIHGSIPGNSERTYLMRHEAGISFNGQYQVTTLSGNGTQSLHNGTGGKGGTSEFDNPTGVAVDSSGNVYVADRDNNVIRKVDSGGNSTTFSGSGTPGLVNGTSSTSQYTTPSGVAVDSANNVYVADTGNNVIRKLNTSGVPITFSGSPTGVPGFFNGTSTTSLYSNPFGVAVDSSNNVYVSDSGNFLVRKLDSSGNSTTLSGSTQGFFNGTGGLTSTSQFNTPYGIAVDVSGNVYVADAVNNMIRKLDTLGNTTTLSGKGTDTIGANAGYVNGTGGVNGSSLFNSPFGLAIDSSGYLYVGDEANNAVRLVDPNGNSTTLAGRAWVFPDTDSGFADGSSGQMGYAKLDQPAGIAIGPTGNIYIADSQNMSIRAILLSSLASTVFHAETW